ncbi:MAG TPA: hypothetical protein DER23_05945 [Clostridiales bacterium]|nr:hypothetical protein [Clostridiales bacterium]
MKKWFFLLLLLVVLTTAVGCENFTIFQDDIYGVSLKYPETWTATTEDENLIATICSPENSDKNREYVSLFSELFLIYDVNMTLAEYVSISESSLGFITNYESLKNEDMTIGDLKGKYIQYSGSYDDDEEGIVYVWTQFVTLKEGYAFVLTHTAVQGVPVDTQTWQTMLQSFAVAANPNYEYELNFYNAYHEEMKKQEENTFEDDHKHEE